jgi:hypothetical protein
MATWDVLRKEETMKSVIFMWHTGGLRQQTHKIIKIVRKEACWISIGEALNITATELQQKIHDLRNKFIVLCRMHRATEL